MQLTLNLIVADNLVSNFHDIWIMLAKVLNGDYTLIIHTQMLQEFVSYQLLMDMLQHFIQFMQFKMEAKIT